MYRLPSGSKLSVCNFQKSPYSCTNLRRGRAIGFNEHEASRSSLRNRFHCFSSLSSSFIRSLASASNESGYCAALSSLLNSSELSTADTGRAQPVNAISFRTVDGATPNAAARLRLRSNTASDGGCLDDGGTDIVPNTDVPDALAVSGLK